MSRSWHKKIGNTLVFEELEPRLLFSADVAEALATDAVEQDLGEEPVLLIDMESEAEAETVTLDQPLEEVAASSDMEGEADADAATLDQPPAEALEAAGDSTPDEEDTTAEELNDQEVSPQTPDETTAATESLQESSESISIIADSDPELSTTTSSNELVFINSNVHDYEQLLVDLEQLEDSDRSIEIIILDNEEDGIEQVSAILADRQDLDAIHIITHGSDGQLALGETWLDSDALAANSEAISAWKDALSEDADILLYGCNIAAGEDGQNFVESLAQLTEADVAASDDLTATTARDGNWDLEYQTGNIEASTFDAGVLLTWDGQLAVVTVTTFNDLADGGDTSSILNLFNTPGSDGISLREAIIATNNDNGADEILLGSGTYTLSLVGAFEDLGLSGDFDILSDLTITGAGLENTIIDGTGIIGRVFDVWGASIVSISGVTIQGGDTFGVADGGAIRINSLANVTISDSLLTDNHARAGGAIYNSGTLSLVDTTIDNNTSSQGGGGISTIGTTSLERVTVSNNQTSGIQGGGIEVGTGSFTATNVTISGNSAGSTGGGIFTLRPISLVNTTITNNTSTFGSGVLTQGVGSAILTNTIIAGNSSGDVTGSFTSGGNNLIGDVSTATGLTDGLNGDQVGTSASLLDPLLGALQDNGGPTWTHALLAGSSAIDAGNTLAAPSEDQRGLSRPVDGDGNSTAIADIGAFEYVPSHQDALWLSTESDENSGGQPGIDTWLKGDLLEINDPNLSFGPTTDGTVSIAFSADAFAPGKDVSAIHYVSIDIQLGASGFQLEAGDLILVSDAHDWTGNSANPDAGFSNDLSSVDGEHDVIVFRPDIANDYSTGSFALLLDKPANADIRGISLIEQDTRVGDADLEAGDFLFTREGGAEDDDVWLYQTDEVGLLTTSGTASVLIEGDEIGIQKLNGIDLVETTIIIGGQTLNSGTILLNSDGTIAAGLPVSKFDIYALHVSATTLVSGNGNGAATTTMFFDGSDLNFNENDEKLDGFTLTTSNNHSPVLTLPGTPLTYTVNNPAEPIDSTATLTDADSSDLDGGALTVSVSAGATSDDELSILPNASVTLSLSDVLVDGTTIGSIDAVSNGTGGADLVIHWNGDSTPASIEAVLRRIAYSYSSATPDLSTRVIDFTLTDGDGGSTMVQQSVNFVAGNAAPVLTLPGDPATFTENDLSPVIVDATATITDDGTDLNNGVLTVSIIANGSNDILSILPGGAISLNSSDIEYDNGSTVVVVGTFSGGTGGTDLVIDWNANSSSAAAQEVLRQIAFSNDSEDPSGLTRELLFTLSDGAGGSSLAVTQEVNVNPVNDAPSGTNNTVETDEETPYIFSTVDFGFSDDQDNDAFSAITITTLPLLGSLTYNAVAVSADDSISADDIDLGLLQYTPPLNGAGLSYATFDFQVQDSGGTANGGIDLSVARTITINVTDVNDAPVATDDTANGDEDTAISGNVLTNDSDTEGSSLSATLVAGPTNGTLSLNGDGSFTYTANADWNGTDSFTYTASDGSLDSN
ncbi:MAG: DUF4347 domain-containing protein, partial [Proteobacteria bacterium]|nr:DUF4347 domain-containing protein [Pseudomonadota bacterium]